MDSQRSLVAGVRTSPPSVPVDNIAVCEGFTTKRNIFGLQRARISIHKVLPS